jgi:hypothetical protein
MEVIGCEYSGMLLAGNSFVKCGFERSCWRVRFLGGFMLAAESGTADVGIFMMGELKALSVVVMRGFDCGG